MKIPASALLVILFILFSCSNNESNSDDCGIKENLSSGSRTLNLLFIGTSHTFYNDLPQIVKNIGKSVGDSVNVAMSAPPGYDFERHFQLEETKLLLQNRKWDYIIAQESGWRGALPSSLTATRVFPFADSLMALIQENNSEAEVILYMTNGYIGGVKAFGDSAWCNSDPQVCTYEGMTDRIRETYLQLSRQIKAEIAPCGVIWKVLKQKDPTVDLHDPDGIHPSLKGSYSNALTIYSLIREKPLKEVFVPAGVAEAEAILVQNTIADALFNCNPNWKEF